MSRIETQGMSVELLSALMAAKAEQPAAPDDGFRTLLDGALQNGNSLPGADCAQMKQTNGSQAEAAKAENGSAPDEKASDLEPDEAESAEDAQALAAAVASMIRPELTQAPESAEETAAETAIPALAAEIPAEQQAAPEPAMPETTVVLQAEATDLPQATVRAEQGDAVQETVPLTEVAEEAGVPIVSAESESSEAADAPQTDLTQIAPPQISAPDDLEAQEKFDRMITEATQELAGLPEESDKAVADTAEPVVKSAARPEASVPRSEATRLREADRDETMDPAQVQAVSTKPQTERTEFKPLESAQESTSVVRTEQIQARVIENLEQQKMEFRMQLQPEDLGKIDVKMVLESGRLAVQIIAASARTSELLQRQMDGLAASLRMGGMDLTSVQVVTQAEAEGGYMQQALDMGQSHAQEEAGEEQSGGNTGKQKADPFAAVEEAQAQGIPQSMLDRAV